MEEEKTLSLPPAGGLARQLLAGWLDGSLVPTSPKVSSAFPMLCSIVNHGDSTIAIRAIFDLIYAGGLAVDLADPDILVAIRRAHMVAFA